MDNKLSDLTIIIVTFRTNISILKDCLSSIDPSVKVLIVENSESFINSEEITKNFNNVNILCTGSNLGMGGGNNFGLENVKTNFSLILNPDIICEKNFFQNIIQYLNDDLEYSIIGSQYLDNSIWKPAGFFSNKKNRDIKFDKSLTKVDWVVGCSMLINLKKFSNKKIFDENFFLFFEEFDLCKRTLINRNLIYSSNKLIVKHLGFKGSFASDAKYEIQALKLKSWHYMWSQFYFNKKYEGIFISYIKGFASLLKNSLKILLNLITNNKLETIKYKYRFLGLLNSMLTKKSSFRINF
tara:strand:+ start:214 stop:1104 length:891 start_codon:yes stop_codon:yes gene_type:complete